MRLSYKEKSKLENTQQLAPIAVKESVAFKADALVEEGYAQVKEAIQCPLCGERFLLMLDSRGDFARPQLDAASRQKTIAFFEEVIMQDHISDHPHWQFRMNQAEGLRR
jgi:hypothetical protein